MIRLACVFMLTVTGCSSTQTGTSTDEVYQYLKKKVEESNSLYINGEYEEAAELREYLYKKYSSHTFINNPEFFARIGDCWRRNAEMCLGIEEAERRNESYSKALKWYETAVEKFNKDLDYFYRKLKETEVRDEQRECEKIIMERIRPRLAEIHTHIGAIHIKQQRYKRAVIALKKALSANLLHPRARYLMGCALDAVGGYEHQTYKSFNSFLQLIDKMTKEEVRKYRITERDIEHARRRLAELKKKIIKEAQGPSLGGQR